MNVNTQEYLEKIDIYLKNKSQKERYMIYIMLFSLLFASSSLLFWDSSKARFEAKSAQVQQMQTEIATCKSYLQANKKSRIDSLELEIKKTESTLELLQKKTSYIEAKIESITSLTYDERVWGKYLHSISSNAKKYGIMVVDFTNEYAKQDEFFGHILDIELKISANYRDTLKFINSLEMSDLVVDIHKLKIRANKEINSNISISLWGIAQR